MPIKGFFTQGVAVLLREKVTLTEIESFLTGFKIVKRDEKSDRLEFSGPSFVVEYRPDVNGYILVDVLDHPWPDAMGDPKGDSSLFAAWSMGHFGPFAYPGSLERAGQHSYAWKEGAAFAAQHQAFIRIRLSYIFGAPGEAPVIPDDYKPADELNFITRMVMGLLQHPAALCYFNPNGEVLAERLFMEKVIQHYEHAKLPPVDLWTNVRRFGVTEGWILMDTVGMQQLDLHDLEACFLPDHFKPSDISLFLRNTSLYLYGAGTAIKENETIDGPGGALFRAKPFQEGMATPPRPTLRFRPPGKIKLPAEFGFESMESKKKWQFWK